MFTGNSNYALVPPDPTRPNDPDQSLLGVLQEAKSAFSMDDKSLFSKMWSLRSNKAREKVNDLHTLATGFGYLSKLVSFAMGPPQDRSATDRGSLHVMHGIVERMDELRRILVPGTMVHPDIEAGISLFDTCRARAFRTEVRHLLPEKQREEGINVCLDKARVFCTTRLGGTFFCLDADDESRAEILRDPGCPSNSQSTGEGSAITKYFDHSQCTMSLHDQISVHDQISALTNGK